MALRIFDLVAGARPNFMKLAPVVRALTARQATTEARNIGWRIVHTGQHYDPIMNDVFFNQLGIPKPEVHLNVGSGTHGLQTANIIQRYEQHLIAHRPFATIVFGDVNSTVACALAAAKLQIPVVHVEAGLRSFDRSMPEEINRVVTDALSDYLFVSEPSGVENLTREGMDKDKIFLVGNVMIDTLVRELPKAKFNKISEGLGLQRKNFGLITLHRPSNVDNPSILRSLLETIVDFSQVLPIVFPVHPRTQKALTEQGLEGIVQSNPNLKCIPPLPYHENLSLIIQAKVVLTDSGGIQEETTWLGIPCITIRDNTERPVTVTHGTNRLVGNDIVKIRAAFHDALEGYWPLGKDIPFWDGKASERIAETMLRWKVF